MKNLNPIDYSWLKPSIEQKIARVRRCLDSKNYSTASGTFDVLLRRIKLYQDNAGNRESRFLIYCKESLQVLVSDMKAVNSDQFNASLQNYSTTIN